MEPALSSEVRAPVVWEFACPICRSALLPQNEAVCCAVCDRVYPCSSGIWRFLPDERLAQYDRFLREYHIVREDQGWGQPDTGYFLALPQVAPDDAQVEIWRRRRASRRLLLARIVEPIAARRQRPLRIADLGAGNGWLTYRLSEMGYEVAAVDLSVDEVDGLGARRWYLPELERLSRLPFTSIQAEFDHLPLRDHVVDLAIFNASLQYSTNYAVTLQEALRVLSPEGTLVIMDSPVYQHASSGEQMVRERERAFHRTYGFRSDSVPAEHFLTTGRLEELARDVGLHWKVHSLAGSMSWVNGRWRQLRGRRELAEMPVIEGSRT